MQRAQPRDRGIHHADARPAVHLLVEPAEVGAVVVTQVLGHGAYRLPARACRLVIIISAALVASWQAFPWFIPG